MVLSWSRALREGSASDACSHFPSHVLPAAAPASRTPDCFPEHHAGKKAAPRGGQFCSAPSSSAKLCCGHSACPPCARCPGSCTGGERETGSSHATDRRLSEGVRVSPLWLTGPAGMKDRQVVALAWDCQPGERCEGSHSHGSMQLLLCATHCVYSAAPEAVHALLNEKSTDHALGWHSNVQSQ